MRLETPADTSSPYISTIQMAPADEDGAGDYAGQECVMTGCGMTGKSCVMTAWRMIHNN